MQNSVGERLRALRKAERLSVVELARRAGVSRNYIHQIESGSRQGRSTILALTDADAATAHRKHGAVDSML